MQKSTPPYFSHSSFHHGLLLVVISAILTLAVMSYSQDFRADDWAYIKWGQQSSLWSAFIHPPPFPYRRPLNAMVWQLQAWFGPEYWGPAQSILVALWLGCCYRIYQIGRWINGPNGALIALVAALALPLFRELIEWRSWLTMTGALMGFLSAWEALLSKEASDRIGYRPFLWLIFGAGFREDTWFYSALLLLSYRRLRPAAFCFLCLAFQSWISDTEESRFALAHLPTNLLSLAQSLSETPLIALFIALPLCWSRSELKRIALFVSVGALPSLLFYLPNPSYFLFPMLVLSIELARSLSQSLQRSHWPATICLSIGLLTIAHPSPWKRWSENAAYQSNVQEAARNMLPTLQPETIDAVYCPQKTGAAHWLTQYLHSVHGIPVVDQNDASFVEAYPDIWIKAQAQP